jgi:hypothetical protein
MFERLFDLPLLITGPAIVGGLWLFAITGLLVVRRRVLPRLRIQAVDSEFSGAMLQAVMVFYGLAVALIAVSVWQSYSDASKLVSQEAAAIGAFYRDVSLYPEPLRAGLQPLIATHLNHLIQEDWPVQRQGKVPAVRTAEMNRLLQALATFKPADEGQKLLHGEALRALNGAIIATRLRVDAGRTGLPGILWVIIVAGAMISLSSAFLFKVADLKLHLLQVLLLATFIGLVIFMIFALDRPFRGDLGLSADPYQLVYDQLMKVNP